MPILFDPEHVIRIVLNSDADKPNPPTFLYRVTSWRETLGLAQKYDNLPSVVEQSGAEAGFELVAELAMTGLVGWENMVDPATGQAVPFDREALLDILTMPELGELIAKVQNARRLSGEDRKKSESPSPTSGGGSAVDALATPESADGSPAPSNPPTSDVSTVMASDADNADNGES